MERVEKNMLREINAREKINTIPRWVKRLGVGMVLLAAAGLTTGNAFADGAQVLRSSPVGLSNIDNPCTLQVESLNFSGFLQQVITPSGQSQFHTLLKSSDGSNLVEVFTGPQPNGNTRFIEVLTAKGATSNAMFEGEVDPNGNFVSFTLSCLGPQS